MFRARRGPRQKQMVCRASAVGQWCVRVRGCGCVLVVAVSGGGVEVGGAGARMGAARAGTQGKGQHAAASVACHRCDKEA